MNATTINRDTRRKLRPVRRHSYLVGISKKLLWGIVALLLLGLAYLIWGEAGREGVRVVFSGMVKATGDAPAMLNPRYQGLDIHNRPFTITAEKAVQAGGNVVDLYAINADITLEHESWLALKAETGKLDMQNKQLDLFRDISMYYEGGYEMRTQEAHVDIQRGSAYGNVPVEGQGPLGTLKANAFEVQDRGARLIFNGAVKMKIYPKEMKKGKK